MSTLLQYTPEPFADMDAADTEAEIGRRRRPPMLGQIKRQRSQIGFKPKLPLLSPRVRPALLPFIPWAALSSEPRPAEAKDPQQAAAGQNGTAALDAPTQSNEPASEHVRWIQRCLNQSMGLQLRQSGLMDADTRQALRLFQERRGLPVTGRMGPATEQALQAACPESAAAPSDSGSSTEVWQSEFTASAAERARWIQSSLNQILGVKLVIDGIVGPKTRSAIRSFQQREGLVVDGIVGPITEAALRQRLGTGAASGSSGTTPATDTGLVKMARPTNATALRQTVVANARSLDGLEAANPAHRSRWIEILGPISSYWDLDRPFEVHTDSNGRYQTRGVSTCGLVAEGIWRRMRVDLPDLYANYQPGTAISRAVGYARKVGAWVSPSGSNRPGPGDYVVIGSQLRTHALTCIAWEGDTLVSIDGGQVGTRNLQAIRECRRRWIQGRGSAMLGDRKVVGWCNAEQLPYRDENIDVPAGSTLGQPGQSDGSGTSSSLPTSCNPYRDAFVRAAQYTGVPQTWVENPSLCLLVRGESGWNPAAKNPNSSAYGLFQFLRSTWNSFLPEVAYGSNDPYWQAVGGFRYIKAAYKTPERAWGFWQATVKKNPALAPADLQPRVRQWIDKGWAGYEV
jgi:peptidoglycan hydrolase-like protein with peptidoglycan-binding domain